ncbi:MAG: exonuclease SbcCD subunit D, partial [Candidatus Scatosoma sp.]
RRKEVRQAFAEMLSSARKNGVAAVLISGDAFDSDRPSLRDSRLFYESVAQYNEITFFYLRGNHDGKGAGGFSEDLPNLRTFGETWKTYSFGDCTVTGAEWNADNAETLYGSLTLPEDKTNIVMLHGDINGEINLSRLKNKNIDYLALGHIHTYCGGAIDERGTYAYSGCLEGRGYDECGKKGYVLLQTPEPSEGGAAVRTGAGSGGKISCRFVPSSIREITEYRVDVSAANSEYEALRLAQEAVTSPRNDLIRIYLTGTASFDRRALEKTVKEAFENRYFFVSVKDETRAKCDFSRYAEETSVKGEFVRLALRRDDLSAEEKDAVIRLGISALENNEAEL